MAFRAQAFPPRRSRESERLDKTERHLRAGVWLARSAPKEASQWDLCSKLGLAQTLRDHKFRRGRLRYGHAPERLVAPRDRSPKRRAPPASDQPVWFGFKPVRIQVLPPSGERNTPETRTNETTFDVRIAGSGIDNV